jgi:hypothetical protein
MRKRRPITTYSGAHANTVLQRGRADSHTCRCGQPAYEWAYTHGSPNEMRNPEGRAFSTDANHYTAMCRRCHRLYDKAHITHCPKSHEYTPENTIMDAGKRKCRTCVYARNNERRATHPATPAQKARKLELQRERRAALRAAA